MNFLKNIFMNKTYKRFLNIYKKIMEINESIPNKENASSYIAKTRLGKREVIVEYVVEKCNITDVCLYESVYLNYKDKDGKSLFFIKVINNGEIYVVTKKHFIKEGQIFDAISELEDLIYNRTCDNIDYINTNSLLTGMFSWYR